MGLFKEKNQKEMRLVGEDLTSALEAVLFLYGEPLSIKKAAGILGVKSAKIKKAAGELKENLATAGRGVGVTMHKDSIQMVSHPDFSGLLDDLIKTDLNEALTPATLETLSIIAYGGPITRVEVDFIRGVNSTFILRQLLLRGLVEREMNSAKGSAYIYSITMDFLRYLGVSSLEDLPEYERFRAVAKSIKEEDEETDSSSVAQNDEEEESGETE